MIRDPESRPGRSGQLPWRAIAGLVAAIALDTLVQLAWKSAAGRLVNDGTLAGIAGSALQTPLVWAVVGLALLQLVNWLAVLRQADLSFVQPLTSLSIVLVGFISWRVMGEPMPLPKLVGIVLILCGVLAVCGTPHRSDR